MIGHSFERATESVIRGREGGHWEGLWDGLNNWVGALETSSAGPPVIVSSLLPSAGKTCHPRKPQISYSGEPRPFFSKQGHEASAEEHRWQEKMWKILVQERLALTTKMIHLMVFGFHAPLICHVLSRLCVGLSEGTQD